MFNNVLIRSILLFGLVLALRANSVQSSAAPLNFRYNGFKSANLELDADGIARYTDNGLLMLTNNDSTRQTGHAFFPFSIPFKSIKSNFSSRILSFSTSFAFAIVAANDTILVGHGMAFVISPTKDLSGQLPSQYLGLFTTTNIGNSSDHILAVELDTVQDFEFGDIDDNHVGIDINSMVSTVAATAGYYTPSKNEKNQNEFKNLSLRSGKPMIVWIDYDSKKSLLDVTLAPIDVPKPQTPLLSLSKDLSPIIEDTMYVGFSASNGLLFGTHYILGWSFATDSKAQDLIITELPDIPGPRKMPLFFPIGLPIIISAVILLSLVSIYVYRKSKFAEELEDWEMKYGPHRFKYKDLYVATKGFKDKRLLGRGGFGKVYKGVLPETNIEIAVKKVSHDSKQGIREFVAEIVSSGRLRHRNLVPLLGYCRRKKELLLVYDYMPKGSLDKYLYRQESLSLSWEQRFNIIKGVASGLLYLHEEWEQVVIHRDIKASNILLDSEFNARIGDFGLARLYDHGSDPHTTHAAGTIGYLAPEHTTTGKATRSTDIYAFGAFLLEVCCGRRPIVMNATNGHTILVNLVFESWNSGQILEVIDINLNQCDYKADEVELVLKLGLFCVNVEPSARPDMRQVVHYLGGKQPLPDLSGLTLGSRGLTYAQGHTGVNDDPSMSGSYFMDESIFVGR
ncbi:hypothetical protein vseg_008738 [Gypsophila vaccaria]